MSIMLLAENHWCSGPCLIHLSKDTCPLRQVLLGYEPQLRLLYDAADTKPVSQEIHLEICVFHACTGSKSSC